MVVSSTNAAATKSMACRPLSTGCSSAVPSSLARSPALPAVNRRIGELSRLALADSPGAWNRSSSRTSCLLLARERENVDERDGEAARAGVAGVSGRVGSSGSSISIGIAGG